MRMQLYSHASGLIQYEVENAHEVVCKAGTSRIMSQNQCSKTGVEEGLSEVRRLEEQARISAFKDAERLVCSQGESAAPAHGRGPLLNGELIRYYVHADVSHYFHMHSTALDQ